MAPYVDHEHAARVVFGLSVAAFTLGEFSQVLRVRRGAATADLRAELVFRAVFFVGILMLPTGRALVPGAVLGGGAGVFALGAIVGWLGLLLRWWSFLTLGSFFTTIVKTSPDQPVVERGPYRVLRHPSYTGLLLAVLGSGVMLGNWVATLCSVVLVLAALAYRLLGEERALAAALGDAYVTFARDRARLVPFVW